MKDHQQIIKEYKKERYKIPTFIFAILTVVFVIALVFFKNDLFYWQQGALVFFGLLSAITFSYRHGHEEGYLEAYDLKDSEK